MISGPAALQVEVLSKHNRSSFPECKGWVEQPTVMYEGIEWEHLNTYHFFVDNFIRLFATITDLKLFDIDRFLARSAQL